MLTGCHMSRKWQEASCTAPKTCSMGSETGGEALGHTWVDATCAKPKHCSVCGETEGSALEHTLTEAGYQQAATCEVCGENVGEPLQAAFEKYGLVCNAELNQEYVFDTPCYDPQYTTKGMMAWWSHSFQPEARPNTKEVVPKPMKWQRKTAIPSVSA